MNENRNNSYLFSSKKSAPALQTCTSCCPFDTQNLPHPQFNYSSIKQTDMNGNGIIKNTDACCLTKLQVDCRIQCQKKKKKNKRYDSIHSSLSTKRSISSSSSSSIQQRKKFTNTNSHFIHTYDSQTSSSASSNTNQSRYKSANAEQSQSRFYINENIQNLKTSIDNLTQLLVHHQKPSPLISFLDKFRRFFSSSKSTDNEECYQILQRNHLTKQNLLNIYHLFNKNELLFLNWLRTIMPEYSLPLLLNYVKHFDSISTDND